jgi:glycosyltransferase involved in cell wall biosynthesis
MLNLAYVTMGLSPFELYGPSTVAGALLQQFVKMKNLRINLVCASHGSKDQIESIFDNKLESVTRLELDRPISYYFEKMREIWKALDCCQLVHFNDFYVVREFYFPIFAFLHRKPIVYSYHGPISHEINYYFVGQRFRHLKIGIEKILFNFEKKFRQVVVVNSKHSKEFAVETEGFKEENTRLIPHGFDLEGLSNATKISLDGEVKLLYTGSLRQAKRVDLILKAIPLLNPVVRQRIRLYIAGGGPLEKTYKDMAAALGIEKYVKFLGSLPLNECYQLYKSCDIFLYASPKESFCISALEAMGSGMPIIAVGSGAIPELVRDTRNGFLVNSNSHEFADKISFLVNHPDVRHQISLNNRQDASKYSWPTIALSYWNLYQSMI